jgi:hypothetical protein
MVETISQECEKNAVQSNLKNHTVTKYPIQYINRDGNPIVLKLSRHARWRFITRWQLVFPEKSLTEESVDKEIAVVFSHASRVKNLSKLLSFFALISLHSWCRMQQLQLLSSATMMRDI